MESIAGVAIFKNGAKTIVGGAVNSLHACTDNKSGLWREKLYDDRETFFFKQTSAFCLLQRFIIFKPGLMRTIKNKIGSSKP